MSLVVQLIVGWLLLNVAFVVFMWSRTVPKHRSFPADDRLRNGDR